VSRARFESVAAGEKSLTGNRGQTEGSRFRFAQEAGGGGARFVQLVALGLFADFGVTR
jgi:hypothetical protein